MREVPLESNKEAVAFAKALFAGEFDMVIFLTGVGTRALLNVVETAYQREEYIAALQRVKVVAREPKPVAPLGELGITAAITASEPNTWRELLLALDEAASREELRLRGARVAVQEYGVSNSELLSGLRERGASVTRVPVYQWALPEDCAPLQAAVKSLVAGEIEGVVFNTGVQGKHPFPNVAGVEMQEASGLLLGR